MIQKMTGNRRSGRRFRQIGRTARNNMIFMRNKSVHSQQKPEPPSLFLRNFVVVLSAVANIVAEAM